jgi:hypothetical protein
MHNLNIFCIFRYEHKTPKTAWIIISSIHILAGYCVDLSLYNGRHATRYFA